MKGYKKLKWRWKKLAYDIGSPYIHPMSYMDAVASRRYGKILGVTPTPTFYEFSSRKLKWCLVEDAYVKESGAALKKFRRKSFYELVDRKSIQTIARVKRVAFALFRKDLSCISDRELSAAYKRFYADMKEMNVWGHIVNLPDFHHAMLSERLQKYAEKRVQGTSLTAPEVIVALTTTTKMTPIKRQERDFYRLVAYVQKTKDRKKQDAAIRRHTKKYDWISFKYDGPTIHDEAYFRALVESEMRQHIDVEKKLREMKKKDKELEKLQKRLAQELGFSKEELYWFRLARTCMFLKNLRKDVISMVCRLTDPMIREISKRLGLTPTEVRSMQLWEIEKALMDGKIDKKKMAKRVSHCVCIIYSDRIDMYTGADADFYAQNYIIEETVDGDVKEIKGMTGCTGYAKGVVRIIHSLEEMGKLDEGDILVSSATNPDLMPAIRKAGAIITDEGGITCHAAIVSRELNIPCVIGTKIATKALKDGDLVEVDATKGLVRKI